MKVYYIGLFSVDGSEAKHLATAKDLAQFGFFEKKSVGEFFAFAAKTMVERTSPGTRQSAPNKSYWLHTHVRQDDCAGVIITDDEYPNRVAYTLILKLLDEFIAKWPQDSWTGNPRDTPYPELEGQLKLYQDPTEADSMLKVQKELDETKIILLDNVEAALRRGENIEDLVAKSGDLSVTSKMFYKQAKKANSCCVVA